MLIICLLGGARFLLASRKGLGLAVFLKCPGSCAWLDGTGDSVVAGSSIWGQLRLASVDNKIERLPLQGLERGALITFGPLTSM